MTLSRSFACATTLLGFAVGSLLSGGAVAQGTQSSTDAGPWQFTATLYGWVPTIDGKANFPNDKGSTDIHVPFDNILNHLKMTFMGTLDAHNGRWGMFTDVLYMDIGGVKSQTHDLPIGNIRIPATATADLSLDLKALVWTVAGEYRVASDPAWTVDLLGGARLMQMKPTLGFSITDNLGPIAIPGPSGTKQVNEKIWNGIVGVKGRYALGEKNAWFLPFYLDVGTGDSKLTWQGAGGVGYAYHWGEVVALYRYLDYTGKSGKPIADMTMGGPQLGVVFRW